jgi:hypothetical protein
MSMRAVVDRGWVGVDSGGAAPGRVGGVVGHRFVVLGWLLGRLWVAIALFLLVVAWAL